MRLTALFLLVATSHSLSFAAEDAPAQDGKNTLTIKVKKTLTLEKRLGGCEASLAIEYQQNANLVAVRMSLTNQECAASHGDFSVAVSYRDEEGERITDLHDENWSRDDDQPVLISRDYEIGDNVDLINVRSRGLSCECSVDESTVDAKPPP